MEIQVIRQKLKTDMEDAQKVLIGIGAEWKRADGDRESMVMNGAETLKRVLSGKDFFIITTLPYEEMMRLGFEKDHMVAPADVSLSEEEWDRYMKWLAGTLNRRTVLLELGEGFKHPSLIRWPFERTASLNHKAFLYRVHEIFYQITEELKDKAYAVHMDSVRFMADWEKEESDGGNKQ